MVPLKALVLASLVGQVPVKSRWKQKGVFHVFLENKLTDSYRVVTILMCIMGDVQFTGIFVSAVTTCDKFLCAEPKQAQYRTRLDFIRETS